MGDPRWNVDQGAIPGDEPILDLAGGHFPNEDTFAMKRIEPLSMAGMEVVASGMAGADGNQVEGPVEFLGRLETPLPGEKAHPPVIGMNLSVQIDELHYSHSAPPR